jgi:hypothetical protein
MRVCGDGALSVPERDEIWVTPDGTMDGAWQETSRVGKRNFAAGDGAGAIAGFPDVIQRTGLLQSK